jgi:site-specific DNA recombinase
MNPVMKTTERPHAIIHTRVSSAKQAHEGESHDVQQGIIVAFAENRGWDVDKIWNESFSGRKSKRPVFLEILDYLDAHPGRIEFYIFRAIDRFTRGGPTEYELMKRELQKRGVQMVDTNGMIQASQNTLADLGVEYDWSRYSPSELTEVVVSTTSKQEITTIQTRMIGQEIRLTRRGFKVRRAQDGFRNVKMYDEGKKRTVMEGDSEREKYYVAMFEMRATGQLTDKEIVERINAMGFRTRSFNRWNKNHTKLVGKVGGTPLTVKMLQEILVRPIYAGFICEKWTNHKPVKAQFPGLVSLDVFNKANRGKVFIQDGEDGTYDILHDHYPEKRVVKRLKDNPLFPYKNVISCPECGMPFLGSSSRSKSGRRVPYYHCSRKHSYYAVNKATFEETIENYANGLSFNPDSLKSMDVVLRDKFRERQAEILHKTVSVSKSITELELQKAQIVEAFKTTTSDLMRRELEVQAEAIDSQIKGSRVERTKLEIEESDIDSFLKKAKTAIEHPSELLLKSVNTTQKEGLYSLVFDAGPTYVEMVNRTPKLSWVFRLSDASLDTESVLAGPVGIEPTMSVLETEVIPLNYRPFIKP